MADVRAAGSNSTTSRWLQGAPSIVDEKVPVDSLDRHGEPTAATLFVAAQTHIGSAFSTADTLPPWEAFDSALSCPRRLALNAFASGASMASVRSTQTQCSGNAQDANVAFVGCSPREATLLESPLMPLMAQDVLQPGFSPPDAPVRAQRPSLLKALSQRCPEAVRGVLELEPGIAQEPFWEHQAEPPLCAAVRLTCCAEVIELLLQHGADVNQADVHRQTPLMILQADIQRKGMRQDVKRLLLVADASVMDIREIGVSRDPTVKTSIPIACGDTLSLLLQVASLDNVHVQLMQADVHLNAMFDF